MKIQRVTVCLAGSVFVLGTAFGVTATAGEGDVVRVSVSSSGEQANNDSWAAAINRTGELIAFTSLATNLVVGDTNGTGDIFVRDLRNNQTTRISIGYGVIQADGFSDQPAISGDGRYVAFRSYATTFEPGLSGARHQVFLHDRETGWTRLISREPNGAEGTGESGWPSIDDSGESVTFVSSASTLPGTAPRTIFVYDIESDSLEPLRLADATPLGEASEPVPSGDGSKVAFRSMVANFVPGDANWEVDAFLFDRASKTATRASVSSDGDEADGWTQSVDVDFDGDIVAFSSAATNLVTPAPGGSFHVYVRDLAAGTTELVPGGPIAFDPRVSDDGNYVVLRADTDLSELGDDNGAPDVYVHDRTAGGLTRASVSSTGISGNGSSSGGCISGNARYVAFTSTASNLVTEDSNTRRDVFRYQLLEPTISVPSGLVRIWGSPLWGPLAALVRDGYPWTPPIGWVDVETPGLGRGGKRSGGPGKPGEPGEPAGPDPRFPFYRILAAAGGGAPGLEAFERYHREIRTALKTLPTGAYFSESLKSKALAALARGRFGPDGAASPTFLRVLNAIELDWRLPELRPGRIPEGAYSACDIGGFVWAGARDVERAGELTVKVRDTYPAAPRDYAPLWPLMAYDIGFDGQLGRDGFFDLTFYVGGFRAPGRFSTYRVLRFDGKLYHDVTHGRDASRRTLTARTPGDGTFLVVRRADVLPEGDLRPEYR